MSIVRFLLVGDHPQDGEGGQNFMLLFIELYEAHTLNLGLLQCLEPFEKLAFGGVCVVDNTVNISVLLWAKT